MQRFLKNIVINLRMCIFCCTVGHCLGFKSNNIVDVISQTIGGRAYPVRHYPIAIRLRDLAFDNKVALTVDCVNIRTTCASALPTRSRSSWGPHDILRHSMCCADSSEWGLFRHNTRSAFRRTPSRTMQSACHKNLCIFCLLRVHLPQ